MVHERGCRRYRQLISKPYNTAQWKESQRARPTPRHPCFTAHYTPHVCLVVLATPLPCPLMFIVKTHTYYVYGTRVNELRGIPGNNMEVVIFFVDGSERCTTDDGSSAGGSSTGGSRGSGRRGSPKEDGLISVCLWRPKKCELQSSRKNGAATGATRRLKGEYTKKQKTHAKLVVVRASIILCS